MCSQSSDQKSGQLVIPGDRLGVIEEFIPNAGTYVRDGVIYSRAVGRALVDLSSRRVSVYPLSRKLTVPEAESRFLGKFQAFRPTMPRFEFSRLVISRYPVFSAGFYMFLMCT